MKLLSILPQRCFLAHHIQSPHERGERLTSQPYFPEGPVQKRCVTVWGMNVGLDGEERGAKCGCFIYFVRRPVAWKSERRYRDVDKKKV